MRLLMSKLQTMASVAAAVSKVVRQNEEQAIVSNHTYGPLQVIAGAGSGKTTTIIYRTANMIADGVLPHNILIATFTKKAAGDIKEKIKEIIGDKGLDVCTGTFHSICLTRILKRYASEAFLSSHNLTSNWEAIDDADQKKLIKQVRKELPDDLNAYMETYEEINMKSIGAFMSIIRSLGLINKREYLAEKSYAIDNGIEDHPLYDINEFIANNYSDNISAFEHVALHFWQRYEQLCRSKNAIDYDDILSLSYDLLRKEPDAALLLSKEWRFICLDEYQDTNIVQQKIMDEIAKHHQNICVVGDDKQSIYMFRGSNIRVIRSFTKRYPLAKVVSLSKNYRSTNQILLTANRIEEAMDIRLSEELLKCPFSNRGNMPRMFSFKNDYEEADYIVNEIKRRIAAGKKPCEIAVLYRQKNIKPKIERKLLEQRVGYVVHGDMSLFESKEVKDTIAMLRFIFRPWSSLGAIRFLKGSGLPVSAEIAERNSEVLGITPHQYLIRYSLPARDIMVSKTDTDEERKQKVYYMFSQVKSNVEHILTDFEQHQSYIPSLKSQVELLTNRITNVLLRLEDGSSDGYPSGSVRKGDITSVSTNLKRITKQLSGKGGVDQAALIQVKVSLDDCMTSLKNSVDKSIVIRFCTDLMESIKDLASICDDPNTTEVMLKNMPIRIRDLIASFWECSMYSHLESYIKTRAANENDGSLSLKVKNVEYIIDVFTEKVMESVEKVFEDKAVKAQVVSEGLEFIGDDSLCMSDIIDSALDELITLLDKTDDSDLENKIQLMTFHAAKGLEFDDVFLAGVSQDVMPGTLAEKGTIQYEEEKRLLYVGLTRARKELDICSAIERTPFGGDKIKTKASEFLDSIVDTVVFKNANQRVPFFKTYIDESSLKKAFTFDEYTW